MLARLGTADPVEPVTSLDALVATVDFSRVGRAAARFSEEELAHLSAQRKERALFHPLRLALTARETGPEMAKFLPLIGRSKTAARLSGQRA